MGRAFGLVRSDTLRACVVRELTRAYRDEPDAKGWPSLREAYPDLFAKAVRKALPNPSQNPSEKES